MDKGKFQVTPNPDMKIEYSYASKAKHEYRVKMGGAGAGVPQEPGIVLQYRVNPQLMQELPLLVMWTNNDQGIFHLKYMINSNFHSSLEFLKFNVLGG